MANTVTPTNQLIHLEPFTGKIFDFNTVNSRIYLARSINGLLSAHGTEAVIEGLTVSSATMDGLNVVDIMITPGKAIVDQTMIEYPTQLSLNIDTTSFTDTGQFLVVNLNFQYINTVFSNLTSVKLRHVSADGNTVSPEVWFGQQDKLVLAVFSFDKTAKTVTQIEVPTISVLPHPTHTIGGTIYEVYPYSNIVKNLRLLTQ